jgi:hypothetical protein
MAQAKQLSKAAARILADLEAQPAALPERADLPRYRRETRAGYEPWVEDAIARFTGEIKDLDINGVTCKQLTPEDWSQREDACILYAYGGGARTGEQRACRHGRLPAVARTLLPGSAAGHAARLPDPGRRLRRRSYRRLRRIGRR